MNASARLNDGQKLKAIKSTTSPLVNRSRMFPSAPLKIKGNAHLVAVELKLSSAFATLSTNRTMMADRTRTI